MRKIDEEEVEALRPQLDAAIHKKEAAEQLIRRLLEDIARAACPWRAGDFVRQAHATIPETPRDVRYKVKEVSPSAGSDDWCLVVEDLVGNKYFFNSQTDLIAAEPWDLPAGTASALPTRKEQT